MVESLEARGSEGQPSALRCKERRGLAVEVFAPVRTQSYEELVEPRDRASAIVGQTTK